MSILVAKLPTKKNERKVNDLDQCCWGPSCIPSIRMEDLQRLRDIFYDFLQSFASNMYYIVMQRAPNFLGFSRNHFNTYILKFKRWPALVEPHLLFIILWKALVVAPHLQPNSWSPSLDFRTSMGIPHYSTFPRCGVAIGCI
jgi:hypothetical protein